MEVFVIAVTSASLGFVLYYFIGESGYFKKKLIRKDPEWSNTAHVVFQRLTGVFFFALVPVIFLLFLGKTDFQGIEIKMMTTQSILWLIAVSAVILPIGYFNSRSEDNLDMYPMIRNIIWSKRMIIVSALSWCAYLLAYEFLFRGLLFFSSLEFMGLWQAILINVGLYSLVHLPKGIKESLGALPMGVVLCLLSFKTGSFWMAFFIHIILALSNEWFSLHFQPEMKLRLKR
jgi:membrane protease YdiL (CAAX protease family)